MFGRYSLSFVRKIRTPVKRTGESLSRIRADLIPLSEDELTKIDKDQNRITDRQIDLPSIDKSNILQVTEPGTEFIKKKKSKLKFEDFVFSGPLTEEVTEDNQFHYLKKAVTPLSLYSYEKQLRLKQVYCEEVLKEIRNQLKDVDGPYSSTRDRLPCPLENIMRSPDVSNYRNMDKFSVHTGVDGNPKTVGYFIGLPIDPLRRCANPAPLVNIRDSHKLVRTHFQKFIEESHYKTCTNFKEGGVWRGLVVRSNLKGELMAVAIIYPNDLTCEEKEELKLNLHNYYFNGPGSECGLSSLYLQACSHTTCSRETAPYELIAGEPYLTEECLGRSFQIYPDSFFPSNTRAAELLFDSVRKVVKLSKVSTLLDVCCGSGIASIHLAPHCRGVLGIDSNASVIQDANINAKINSVKNVNFIHNKIEKGLPLLTKDLNDSADVVAVLNPPRAGLRSSLIESLRKCESIKQIIYITCKPEKNVIRNLAMLGSTLDSESLKTPKIPNFTLICPKLYPPFTMKYAIPVDLSPHTARVEFVFLMERVINPVVNL